MELFEKLGDVSRSGEVGRRLVVIGIVAWLGSSDIVVIILEICE